MLRLNIISKVQLASAIRLNQPNIFLTFFYHNGLRIESPTPNPVFQFANDITSCASAEQAVLIIAHACFFVFLPKFSIYANPI